MLKTESQPLILIADDDLEAVGLISKFLYENKFRILPSFSSIQAIGLVYKKKPDLIIINIMMHGLETNTFTNLLKVNPDTKDIPVIFTCNETNSCDGYEGEGLSYEDIILKPIETNELLAKILSKLKNNIHNNVAKIILKNNNQIVQ